MSSFLLRRRFRVLHGRRLFSTFTHLKDETHFGYRSVRTEEKENLVAGVFDSVAPAYDMMNDAMSLGVHRLWKNDFVSLLNPDNVQCIDVAGGTGDIALRILDHARERHACRETSVDVVDINPNMLDEGRKRFRRTMYHATPQVNFHVGNAEELQFEDNSYDLYTIAFGIRNCTNIPKVLSEARRVLRPGGTFACLEFSKVESPPLAMAYEKYSFSLIPLLGTILAGDRESYEYLVESIQRFPTQDDFADMIKQAGFTQNVPGYRNLWNGIAAIHTGVKL